MRNRTNTICWILLLLFVITALAMAIISICSHSTNNIITDPGKLEKWETVYEDKDIFLDETLSEPEVITIKHWPPRVVGLDGNIVITVKIDAKEKTTAYIYMRENGAKSGLRYPIDISRGSQLPKFKIDMGSDNITGMASDNLTKIQNAELYILNSDSKKLSNKFDEFEVLRGGNFTPTIGIFITMIAIVVALLSLWPQQMPDRDGEKSEGLKKSAVTLKRFWSYMTVLIALLSLIAFLSQFSPHIKVTPYIVPVYFVGLGLLVSSITMVVLSIFESIVSVLIKGFCNNLTKFDQTVTLKNADFSLAYKVALVVLIIFVFSLCISLIALIAYKFSWKIQWLCIFPVMGLFMIIGAHIGLRIWAQRRYRNSHEISDYII